MISKRANSVDSSGIRRIFDLASKLKDPINLSMGQPDFEAFDSVKLAATHAINEGFNRYLPTQGLEQLRDEIASFHGFRRGSELDVLITSGVTGGLVLSYMATLDPGDEVLIPDPFFVVYRDLATIVSSVPVYYDTYPNFRPSAEKIEQAISPRTKALVLASPANPTGYAMTEAEYDAAIEIARRKNLVVIYDEIYSHYCYDSPPLNVLGRYSKTIALNGFSKSAGIPGWRLGYAIGPTELISQMSKLQQFTFVCANSVAQAAVLGSTKIDFSEILIAYRGRRDFVCKELAGLYEFEVPGGAFYLFPKVPVSDALGRTATEFVSKCVEKNLLVIPGSAFSRQDSHFRISFSAPLEVLERGVQVLRELVR